MLTRLFLELLLRRLLFLLAHLGQHNFAEDGTLRDSGEALLLTMAIGLVLRDVETLREHPVLDLVCRRMHGVGWHVAHSRRVLFHVLLQFKSFNAVGELDEFDPSSKARPGGIRANLWQQVFLTGSLAC